MWKCVGVDGCICQRGELHSTVTQWDAESGASHFHLSHSITLKDVGSEHGRVRGFTQETTMIEVPLDLQEDKISARTKTRSDEFTKYPHNHYL